MRFDEIEPMAAAALAVLSIAVMALFVGKQTDSESAVDTDPLSALQIEPIASQVVETSAQRDMKSLRLPILQDTKSVSDRGQTAPSISVPVVPSSSPEGAAELARVGYTEAPSQDHHTEQDELLQSGPPPETAYGDILTNNLSIAPEHDSLPANGRSPEYGEPVVEVLPPQ